jgi:hypothetical protein
VAAKRGGAKARAATAKRQPKVASSPASTSGLKPLFSFAHVDRASKHKWAFKPDGDHATTLLAFICEMSQLTWGGIEQQRAGGHKKHHTQDIATMAPDAQKDLRRTKLDETFGGDEMFRFRLAGEQRLWGFRNGRIFHVVWWDWDHKVYPTPKK